MEPRPAPTGSVDRSSYEPVLESREVSPSQCLLACPSVEEFREVTDEFALSVDGEAQEDMLGQHYPLFILLETLAVVGSWFWTVAKTGRYDSRGGLDSFFADGQTLLKFHDDCEDKRWEVWRWWTYQFTHDSLSHICCNLLIFLGLGVPLESFQGTLRVLFVFQGGVLGSGFAHFVSSPHSALLGMSGGCFALIGMSCAELAMNWSQIKFRMVKLAFLAIVVGSMVLESEMARWFRITERFDHWAHFGGFATGVFFGVGLGRKIHDECCKRTWQVTCIAAGVAAIALSVVLFLEWPPRGLWDKVPWCWARLVTNNSHFSDLDWHCVRCQTSSCISWWANVSIQPPRRVSWIWCKTKGGWNEEPW